MAKFVLKENRFQLAEQRDRKEDWMSPWSGKIHIVCEKCSHHHHAYLNGYNDKFPSGDEYIQGPAKHFVQDDAPEPYVPGADEPPKREEPPPFDDDITF